MKKYNVYELINQMGTVEYVGETTRPNRRFYQHTKDKPSSGLGKFYRRQDLYMNIVKTFDNRKEARLFEGELKLAYGMEWTEKTRDNKFGKIGSKWQKDNRSEAVIAYNYKTGEWIGEFPSLMEAERLLTQIKGIRVHNGNIAHVLSGRYNHTAGYTFKYKS